MNSHVTAQSTLLDTLKNRYFSFGRKGFVHYGDCDIYQATRPFCSCGLLYQFNHLDYYLAEIVYPDYSNESYLQDHGKKRRANKKKEAEAQKLLDAVFGKIDPPTFEEIKEDHDLYSKVLDSCFTKKEFPSAFKRLEKWVMQQVKKHD